MSYMADEKYDVYDERRRRARVERPCDACGETMARGHTYWRIGIVFDGRAETVCRCERCQALHEHLRGLGETDEWPDEKLNCGLSYEDEWGELPPEIAALAFLSADEAQQQLVEFAGGRP